MDATTLPSFAVSSLCAATASCGAASLGYAWATTGEQLHSSSSHSLTTTTTTYATSSVPRPSTSLRRPDSTRVFLQRPQSAIVHSSRDNSWTLTPAAPAGTRLSHQSLHSGTPVESLQETEASIEDNNNDTFPPYLTPSPPRRSRSAWFRRRRPTLTNPFGQLTPSSQDSPASLPPLHTEVSNTPFLPTPPSTTTPRNRLVKRSVSQNLHGRSSFDTNNPTTLRSTFLRPATSHQRSADTRLQALRHQHSRSSAGPSLRPSKESFESGRQQQQQQPPQQQQQRGRGWRWQPFFKKQVVRVKGYQEPLVKDPSSIFLTKKDELRCILGPKGELPTLVMAASITARGFDHEFVTPSVKKTTTHDFIESSVLSGAERRMSQFREDLPESSPNPPPSRHEGTARFPVTLNGSTTSTSPTTFKVFRRRSAKRATLTEGGEVIEANGVFHTVPDNHLSPSSRFVPPLDLTQQPIAENDGIREAELHDSENHEQSTQLPGMDNRVSMENGHAYSLTGLPKDTEVEGDAPRVESRPLKQSSGMLRRHSLPSCTESVDREDRTSVLSTANLSSANARFSRGSRVVSEPGSAAGAGSDTDNSRVFSINGEDTDGFSDTNYDSLRTGGTSSSNSGARSTRIDGVFLDTGKETGFNGEALSVLEEKLSDASLSSSSRLGLNDATPPSNTGENGNAATGSWQQNSHQQGSDLTARAADPTSLSSSSPHHSDIHDFQQHNAKQPIADEDLDLFWDAPELHTKLQTQDTQPFLFTNKALSRRDHLVDELSFSSLDFHDIHIEEHEDERGTSQRSVPQDPVGSSSQPSKQVKVDLWAYSEHNPANVQRDARPQTVHGKSVDRDGQRVVYRRAAHHRSHSEPKIADDMKPYSPEMFQLGKKGASENWDSDFEDQFQDPMANLAMVFDRASLDVVSDAALPKVASPEISPLAPAAAISDSVTEPVAEASSSASPGPAPGTPSTASATTLSVRSNTRRPQGTLAIPSYISDLQNTVRGQFKAVGELKMLVEELRRLIAQAEKFNIKTTDRARALREEALGIIQLSDADEIEATDAWRQPKSPGESILSTSPTTHRPSPINDTAVVKSRTTGVSPPTSMAEAVVKNMAASKPDPGVGTKKTNFDTMALKELVSRANTCVAGLKGEIADAEGSIDHSGSPAVMALKDVFRSP